MWTTSKRRIRFPRLFMCLVCLFVAPVAFAHHIKPSAAKAMPVTTSSLKAKDLHERALQDYENLYLERANIGWRAAVEADPNFAVGYIFLAYNSSDPVEAQSSRQKARRLAPKTTPGERLLIQWIAGAKENNFIAAISAMNDLLEMYPKDKRLAYLAGGWMMAQNSYEQAQKTLERALVLDRKYPPALNDVAYCYAHDREYQKAFAMMERYVAVLPKLPNPQDSYAEILRMSGNFDAALKHYRAALKIDPEFDYSQLGLADTYALMGDQPQARIEYDKAIRQAHTEADRLSYALQKAITWARENDFAQADKAFAAAAEKAHAGGFDFLAAEAHRMMSLYQTDDAEALKHLLTAEEVLSHQDSSLSQSDREEERARLLRYRAVREERAGKGEVATQTLQQLETMAGSSRSAVVQSSYHGATGTVLMSRHKVADAIGHLEEDEDNPYSLELLSQAYSVTGANEKKREADEKLRTINLPTMEQALVVKGTPARRAQGE
jgi:tetratricopeptide (TPR) repeat protein